jgi:hypothetical protein
MKTLIQLIDKTGDTKVCAALPMIAQALAFQANGEFADAWLPGVENDGIAIEVATSPDKDAWPCFVVETLDDPQALAYHTTESGYPVLYVGWGVIRDNGGTLTEGSNSLSAAMSHEVLESLADAFCDFYASQTSALAALVQANGGSGDAFVALEVCDPVQGSSYGFVLVDGTVSVSNFVTPEWFRDGASIVGFDHMGTLDQPGEVGQGGYVALSDGSQFFDEKVPAWKKDVLTKFSRRDRHLVDYASMPQGAHEEPKPYEPTRCQVPGCPGFAIQHTVLCAEHRGAGP